MKILQLIYSLSSGGGERFVVDLSNQLVQFGHDVTICMLLNDEIEKYIFNKQFINKDVRFHSLKFNSGFSLCKMFEVESYIKKIKPDIVHCHLNVIPYIFRLSLFNKKIQFIHTLHNVASAASGGKGQWRINKIFYKKGYIQPVAISNICKNSYENYYRLYNAPCIDNGRSSIFPTSNFELVKNEIDNLKKNSSTKVFIHVARCHYQKNQSLLIDSFNEINKLDENYILLILGSDYNESEGQILKNKSCSKIYFLGEKTNIGDYMLCSDAFCLSSNYEGLPISLLEALSCGLTPICTPVGGIPDVIKNGINGYLSENLTIESYVDAIKRFFQNPLDKEMLKDYYRNNYSIERCTEEYLNLYSAKIQ